MDKYSYIANAHADYLDGIYALYKADPKSVDPSWEQFFEGFDFAQKFSGNQATAAPVSNGAVATQQASVTGSDTTILQKEIAVRTLINSYRTKGHLVSTTNPVRQRKDRHAGLDLATHGLSDADLGTTFIAGEELGLGTTTLQTILTQLQKIYTGNIGFEYNYIHNVEIKQWLKEKIEQESIRFSPSLDTKKRILSKLNEAVVFENFLHTKYIGQKRFSLEGGETTIVALDGIINLGGALGVKEVVIGMAHRGRLNVLCNIMGKTYENIFSEFEGNATPDLTMGDGDVKYHMGFSSEVDTLSGNKVNLKLCPNPSHLEAVNPVVEGYVRAKADSLYNQDYKSILPILIHGDAAVAGQGVVYEVTQFANLKGYYTGGTIHFVINNQIGFTTDFDDARSATYCTDVAKIIDAPVMHVNGDDPESVLFVTNLATEFRQKFGQDIFIDMVCYRRHGHNESDEPKFTQPTLYNIIAKHANPREVYNKLLVDRGDVDAQLAQQMDTHFRDLLQDRLNMVKQYPLPYKYQQPENEWRNLRRSTIADFDSSPATGIPAATVDLIGKALVNIPENFKPIKQVENLLKERHKMFTETKQLNWAAAELLAYGSILLDGKTVRLSGQDVQRGTFSHRHAVIHDANTNQEYNSLNNLKEGQITFQIYNSLLSEYGVLGFEFGYAMAGPNTLTIWEAQFGDFSNGAQVMIDQFITCSETKWQRMNGLVLLLPHGYEGQGPEHSNARPERFLSLCAESNMFVTNITQPANFFHLLRRQLALPFRKPLVNFSPKSLLRNPIAVSPLASFIEGSFQEVIGDTYAKGNKVTKAILCTGKVYYDLLERQQTDKRTDVAIIRLEQLHPWPTKQLAAALANVPKAKICFVQEEPENMGACTFVLHQLRSLMIDFVARKPSASPATGYAKVHAAEQADVIARAFGQ